MASLNVVLSLTFLALIGISFGQNTTWYYLDHGEGTPFQCGEVIGELCCASNDGQNCQWGWYGQSYTPYQPMDINIVASNPACITCPGWPTNDGSDPCQQLQCYEQTTASQSLEWLPITSTDILSTSSRNASINVYTNDTDNSLIIEGTLESAVCGDTDPSNFAVYFDDNSNQKWQRIRYTIEFVSGSSSCWSILGSTTVGGFNVTNLGLYEFNVADGDVLISNSLTYGSWNGETTRCDDAADNFLHSQYGTGYKGSIRVEQRRNMSAPVAGIGSGYSCAAFGSIVRYKDIQVAYVGTYFCFPPM